MTTGYIHNQNNILTLHNHFQSMHCLMSGWWWLGEIRHLIHLLSLASVGTTDSICWVVVYSYTCLTARYCPVHVTQEKDNTIYYNLNSSINEILCVARLYITYLFFTTTYIEMLIPTVPNITPTTAIRTPIMIGVVSLVESYLHLDSSLLPSKVCMIKSLQ